MICESNVFFKSFKGLPRGGSRPILRISQKRLGGPFGCKGGAPEGVRTKQGGFGRAQDLHKNIQSVFFVFLGG